MKSETTNKWAPKILSEQKIEGKIEVEIIRPQPRYLGKKTSNPAGANLGDYYYNGTKVKFYTESGWI